MQGEDGGCQQGPAGLQAEDRKPEQGEDGEGEQSGHAGVEQVKRPRLVSVEGSLQQQRGAHHRPVVGQAEEVPLRQNAPEIRKRTKRGVGENHLVVVIEKPVFHRGQVDRYDRRKKQQRNPKAPATERES